MPKGPFLATYLNKLPSLRRFVARFVVRDEDVDDILQETYFRVSDKDTKGIACLSAYMYKTARNIALNELNRKAVSVTDYLEDIVGPDIEEEKVAIEEQVYRSMQMEVFVQAVHTLPKQCRKVFVLRKIYGLSHVEISTRVGISKPTIEKHITRGLTRCREHMEKQGYSMKNLQVVKKLGKIGRYS